jgi:predicted RNase H-like HicB family nuclease
MSLSPKMIGNLMTWEFYTRKPPERTRMYPAPLRQLSALCYDWRTGVDPMKAYTAIVEKCPQTGLYVGYVPGFPGAHSQGETLDELRLNLREVVEMLLEDGDPVLETEFIGIQTIQVA